MILFHGSKVVIDKPLYGFGKPYNDYGPGFYCTEDIELAKEWACQDPAGGFVNTYEIDTASLSVCELDDNDVTAWISLLISNRVLRYGSPIEKQGADHLIKFFKPDISKYDLITGYRADDSYFSYARAFLSNTISLEQLREALRFGNLGKQVCLKSQRSFEKITFLESAPVLGSTYYPKRIDRDKEARDAYYRLLENNTADGTYIRDIIAKELKPDDLRI